MTGAQHDIDPAAVKAAHTAHSRYANGTCSFVERASESRCDAWLAADALATEQRAHQVAVQQARFLGDAAAAITVRADAAERDLAAEQAKVARVYGYAQAGAISEHAMGHHEAERKWLDLLIVLERLAVADQPEQGSDRA